MTTLSFWLPCAMLAVVRKIFGRMARRQIPYFDLSADETGLRLRAIGPAYGVEYFQAGEFPVFRTPVPLELLEALRVRDQPLELSRPQEHLLLARWHDRGVPRSQEYPLPESFEPPLPVLPEAWSENSPDLLDALREAVATTDTTSTRYAFHCLQLRGSSGEIAATEGRQGLVQREFNFPFQEDLLVGGTAAFQCKALHTGAPVQVGITEKQFVVRTGAWTLWLPIEVEARFPRLEDCIPLPSAASTSVEFADSDLEFLRNSLDRLPATQDDRAVTLDLNGTIAVRAAPAGTSVPTEIILSRSTKSGDDLRIPFGREYLARVAAMNLPRLHLYGPEGVLRASDHCRTLVWMPYKPSLVVLPHPGAMRVEAPALGHSRQKSLSRRQRIMSHSPTPAAPVVNSTPVRPRQRTKAKAAAGTSIDAAIALHDQVRGTLRSLKDLVRQLKAERKQQRLLKTTLNSLKQLQQAA